MGEERAGHFERVAAVYDGARPPYPAEVIDALGLVTGTRVLELGAGTGLATRDVVRRGAVVTAVEPGPELAARLRAALPEVEVLVATAETAPMGPAAHDVVVVATALHWMDLDVLLPRLHRALVPGGRLAVLRTVFTDPDAAPTDFRRRVQAVRGEAPRPDALDLPARAAELEAGGWFEVVDARTVHTTVDLTPDRVRALFTTFSDWTAAEVEQVVPEEVVTDHHVTVLLHARRVG